jgi:hypothetical protein
MNIEVVEISSPSKLPKSACREYAGIPASEAVTAFQKTGQTPGAIYQYGERLFVFAIENKNGIGHSDNDK